jgi:hypothetical protein
VTAVGNVDDFGVVLSGGFFKAARLVAQFIGEEKQSSLFGWTLYRWSVHC